MILELHLIQNFAPSNLNRSDTGAPKDCIFGGVRRARISSQCFKRAMREHFRKNLSLSDSLRKSLGERTKRLATEVLVPHFVSNGHGADDSAKVAEVLLGGISVWIDDEKKTEYLLYFGNEEITQLKNVGLENFDTLLELHQKMQEIKAERKEKPKKKSAIKKIVKDALGKSLEKVLDGGRAVDIALFGRMLADLPNKQIEAASQIANSISTHKTTMEFDFYTAVDTLKPDDTPASDMLGTIEFNSACYYRYANIDIAKLEENLAAGERGLVDGPDHERLAGKSLAKEAVKGFFDAMYEAKPTGKQTWSGTNEDPGFVFAVVRNNSLCSMANAFEKPVKPTDSSGLVEPSIKRFVEHWNAVLEGTENAPIEAKVYMLQTYDVDLKKLQNSRASSVSQLRTDILRLIFGEEV